MNPELSRKWWQFWIRKPKPKPSDVQVPNFLGVLDRMWEQVYRDTPTETPFLSLDDLQEDPYAEQRRRFLKQQKEGHISMRQYHACVQISRLTEDGMISKQEAVDRYSELFPLKELRTDA